MRKILTLSLLLGSMAFGISSANAAETSNSSSLASNAAAAAPQVRIQIGQNRRWNNRQRVVTQVRIVRVGGRVYRETYRTTYFGNGRSRSQLVSRVRVR